MSTIISKAAICYGRYSTSEQSKGFSLERQKQKAVQFAHQKEWTVEKVIFDEGRSAFHGANRLEGSVLHEFELEARNGLHKGKVLVCENIDRLSRQGAKAAAQLIWSLNENGVDVATFHDGHVYKAGETEDLIDLFKIIIDGQQAYGESFKKSERTKGNWQDKFRKIGEGTESVAVPNVPHWLNRVDGKYVLNEHRVKILNEIYDLYLDGIGISRIANMLNARGEPVWSQSKTRNINGWYYPYIWRLLTKRIVLGEYVNMKGETVSPDFFPQAVTTEKWNRVQATLAMRKSNQPRTKNQNKNLLAQMVFCAECGGGAHFEHTTGAMQTYKKVSGEVVNYRRKTYRRLRCDRSRRKHQCGNPTILNYDVIEYTVLQEMIGKLIQRPDANQAVSALRGEIAELIRLRDTDQTRLDNLVEALADGGSKAIVQRIEALEGSVDEQSKKIETLQRSLAVETSRPATADDAALIEQLKADLTSDDEETRIYARGRANMVLRRLIKRIVLNADDTFTIWPDDLGWWQFDETGKLIDNLYVP